MAGLWQARGAMPGRAEKGEFKLADEGAKRPNPSAGILRLWLGMGWEVKKCETNECAGLEWSASIYMNHMGGRPHSKSKFKCPQHIPPAITAFPPAGRSKALTQADPHMHPPALTAALN